MRVEPELFEHPKFLKLRRRVGEYAAEALLRIWAHCQNSQRGERWLSADPEYVEVVARWTGPNGALYESLLDCRFIDERAGVVVIHDWEYMNSNTVNNWKKGKMGGRPRKQGSRVGSARVGLRVDGGKAGDNPQVSGGEGAEIPIDRQIDRLTESVQGGKKKGGQPGVIPVANTGATVAALKTKWAALTARIKELEGKGRDRTKEEAEELRKNRAELAKVQKQQRELVV